MSSHLLAVKDNGQYRIETLLARSIRVVCSDAPTDKQITSIKLALDDYFSKLLNVPHYALTLHSHLLSRRQRIFADRPARKCYCALMPCSASNVVTSCRCGYWQRLIVQKQSSSCAARFTHTLMREKTDRERERERERGRQREEASQP